LHLVGILFPHINEDAQSKSHQIIISIHFLPQFLSYIFRLDYIIHISVIVQHVTLRTSVEIGTHQYASPETQPFGHQCHISSK